VVFRVKPPTVNRFDLTSVTAPKGIMLKELGDRNRPRAALQIADG
jgi:hypothetical protein